MSQLTPAAPPPRPLWRRAWFAPAAVAVAAVLVFALWPDGGSSRWAGDPPVPTTPSGEPLREPDGTVPELWEFAIADPSAADAELLADPDTSTLDAATFAAAGDVAAEVVAARATGEGRDRWPGFFVPGAAELDWVDPPAFCADFVAVAANSQPVAGSAMSYVQTLVVFDADCPAADAEAFAVPVLLSLDRDSGELSPVWASTDDAHPDWVAAGVPATWELAPLDGCGAPGSPAWARAELVAAFEVMCAAAADDGVDLVVTSALRTPAEQSELFAAAVDRFGSPAAARRWVQPADAGTGVCASRHCAGEALDVDLTPAARRWLFDTVGCLDGDGSYSAGSSCASGAPVRRLERFGFAATIGAQPHHLELGLPLPLLSADSPYRCDPPPSMSTAQMVLSVFRCAAMRAGVPASESEVLAVSAVVAARCSSGWNPAAVAFGGRFVDEPNPATGRLHDEVGVFAFSVEDARTWVPGGPDARTDPVANITGAARWALAERAAGRDPFGPFDCATGRVPSSGGELPGWAADLML